MIFKNKALAISILAAAVWHLLWISAINVVIVPENIKIVRFPKISFLGPVVGGRTLSLRTEGREKSFLEKRFSGYSDAALPKLRAREGDDFIKGFYSPEEESLSRRISDSLIRPKSPPPNVYSEG